MEWICVFESGIKLRRGTGIVLSFLISIEMFKHCEVE